MDVYTYLYPCTPVLQKQWGLDRDDRALQGSQQAVQDSQDCADRGALTSGLDRELLAAAVHHAQLPIAEMSRSLSMQPYTVDTIRTEARSQSYSGHVDRP